MKIKSGKMLGLLTSLLLSGPLFAGDKPGVKGTDDKDKKEKEATTIAAASAKDPYESAHRIFATASTRAEYQHDIKEYSAQQVQATELQKSVARVNKGEARLAIGDTGGFYDREARLDCPEVARLMKPGVFPAIDKPLKAGDNLDNATVAVIVDEGGFGDAFEFAARYIAVLKQSGKNVKVIAVAPPTPGKVLYRTLDSWKIMKLPDGTPFIDGAFLYEGQREPVSAMKGAPKYTHAIHHMSLPTVASSKGMVPTTIHTIPTSPYMVGHAELVAEYDREIGQKPGIHVAYCNQASDSSAGVVRVLDRTVPREDFEESLKASPVKQIYSIQGPGAPVGAGVVDVGAREKEHGVPFAHSTALLVALRNAQARTNGASIGRFAGVCTGPTCLAKATGTPGYIVLKTPVVDWRNGVSDAPNPSTDRTPSPFAPNLKLLRADPKNPNVNEVQLRNLTLELIEDGKQLKIAAAAATAASVATPATAIAVATSAAATADAIGASAIASAQK